MRPNNFQSWRTSRIFFGTPDVANSGERVATTEALVHFRAATGIANHRSAAVENFTW